MNQTRSRRHLPGFSLLELMLVLAIIGILMSVVAFNVLGQGNKAKITATRATLTTIKTAMDSYYLTESAYPPTLTTLITAKYLQDMPMQDAWKNPLFYNPRGLNKDRPYQLGSAGEDGQPGTPDDIDVWTMNAPATTGGN